MASTTKYLTLSGKAFWARIFPENRDLYGFENQLEESGGQYVLQVALDEDSLANFATTGSLALNYPKTVEDDEGKEYVSYKFARHHRKYNRAGDLLEWASGAPKVYEADGTTPWDIENNGYLGNGSKVTIKICCYKAGPVVGTRLDEIIVDELVAPPVMDAA